MRVLDEGGAAVVVSALLDRPAAALELCGELPCWQQPIAMQRAGSTWRTQLRLADGVYEMKLRDSAGGWHVDPAWRTVARDGVHNGVLVVGGTEEPVLHAPAAPWLRVLADGRVVIRAALRGGHRDRLALRADDGGGWRTHVMRTVGGDDSHVWFETELAGAGGMLEYAFLLADGRMVAASTGACRVKLRELADDVPAWWRDAVVYTIFVDRFRRGGRDWHDARGWQPAIRAGGDLDGVREALPYLADLGVSALHLTPICVAPSVHRYDAIDPTAVDPALGGEAAFQRLVEEAHVRNLRVLVDVAATHVHRDCAPFRHVREHGPASPYWRWFRARRWPFAEGPDPGYEHYQKGQWQEPLLALDEPEVQDEVVSWFTAWVTRGVDGVRVDAAADLPVPLIARIRAAVRTARPDAVVFGEVVPACVDRFAPRALDAGTDFVQREALVAFLRGEPAATFARAAAGRRWRGAASELALGFTGTHDQPRIATVTQDAALARLGLVATVLGARIPMLYYGDELGLCAGPDAIGRDFEDSWPDRQPMPWREDEWDRDMLDAVRAAIALRRDHALLRRGDEDVRAFDEGTLLVRRQRLGDTIDIAIHRNAGSTTVELPGGPAQLMLAVGDVELAGTRLRLGPRALAVIDRRDPHDVELACNNAAIAAAAFAAGHVECPAYPSRLYVTVTEACNLRCAHCITNAPDRTRSGRARTLQPWLLDALDEAFAHADYIAFTHGGESLAAPIFPEVLRRIARARVTRPGHADIHLVTNGMLLDERRAAELIDLGVTSLMVSLDGATAVTNDRIRVLGRFERVVANLAAVLRLRARRNADLRIGISTVVGASNVRELTALGRLCLDLGVDWLKIEETYPATPFARRDLHALDAGALAAAIAELRDVLAGQPLVLVDHLAPPAACACSDDSAARAFRAADDFANRAMLRPCRAAWEQAAIDPDGVLHAVDYAGPALGSLLDTPVLALWNAHAALAARDRALAATTPERRRRCIDRDCPAPS